MPAAPPATARPAAAQPETFGFFLVPKFSMIAFTAAVEPLRLANRMSGKELYRWQLYSTDGGPVRASNGIALMPDAALANALGQGKPDAIVVCGGIDVQQFADKAAFAALRRYDRQGVALGAVCTGSHVLALAGLLDGHRCTIHWENLDSFTEAFPGIEVSTDLFEIDRHRFTCCGGTAALDMMLHLIGQRHGTALATAVSDQCILERIRDEHDAQRMPLSARLRVNHPKLVAAIGLMEANLEQPLGQDELARRVGLSRRQLERLFRRYLRKAPARHYLELRLQRARLLLLQSTLSIIDVALACGFVSASHFSKCYRQAYQRSPKQERGIAPDAAAAA
ncbi:MAG: GlxA family transcriptional regulator [Alphaproteobacteria bacterium]|nr:GlxA family transcriptional regulator [Alphaproteobacteria bacterium]